MSTRQEPGLVRRLLRRLVVVAAAFGLALAFFLVLPLMQAITRPPDDVLDLRRAETAELPPPPPPAEPEPEPEPEPEQPPPQLAEEAPPLDLSQLELVLNPGLGEGWMGGDFAVKLNTEVATAGAAVEALFSVADLDQPPRATYQPSPVLTKEARRKLPGAVNIIFIVGPDGRVENPLVQSASDPVFEKLALSAVKQWRFEPGRRGGQPVRFRMRVPITF